MKQRWSTWSRRRKAGLFLGVGVLIVAGVAAAAWLTFGEGNTQTHAGTLAQLTVVPEVPSGAQLFPGQEGALAFRITNPNASDLIITNLAQIGPTQVASSSGTCPGTNVTLGSGASGLTIPLPGGASGLLVEIPNGAAMSSDAPTGCQAGVFRIPARVNATTP